MINQRRTRRPFTPEEDRVMLELQSLGLSYEKISRHLQRNSASSVKDRIRKLLGRPPPPKALSRPKTSTDPGGVVRCLGGCGKTFASPDRCRIRICPVCRKRESRTDVFATEHALHL